MTLENILLSMLVLHISIWLFVGSFFLIKGVIEVFKD